MDLVASRGVKVAVTVGDGPRSQTGRVDEFEVVKANVEALRRRNVLMSFGTDTNGAGRTLYRDRLWGEVLTLRDVGLSPAEILAAMTRDAAIYLGREGELGTIEEGKLGDLVIVKGDPLSDLAALRNVVIVVKGGSLVVDNRLRFAVAASREIPNGAGLPLSADRPRARLIRGVSNDQRRCGY